MAEMVSTTVSFPKWTLANQAAMDACAEELWVSHTIPSNIVRGQDEHGTEVRNLLIHSPDPDNPFMVTASVGTIVILFNGAVQGLTAEEYAGRGFSA